MLWRGRYNLIAGFAGLLVFMAYGFLLIYLRDFAPGHEEWARSYGIGKHFEARLAHVHGNLFAVLNLAIGLLLARRRAPSRWAQAAAGLALVGLLMPAGILAEVYLGTPPLPVLVGAAAMTGSVAAALGLVIVSDTEEVL